MPKRVSRKDAKALGLIRYYTGQPCKHGHRSERNTSTGSCLQCVRMWAASKVTREQRAAYYKAWRQAHPEHRLIYTLRECRLRAKKRGLEFDLTLDDLIVPEFCPVLGLRLEHGKGRPTANSPSIDRIDPNKGYTKDNICIISRRANMLKSNGSLDEFQRIVAYMKKHLE